MGGRASGLSAEGGANNAPYPIIWWSGAFPRWLLRRPPSFRWRGTMAPLL